MLDYLKKQDRIKKLLNDLLNPGFVEMENPEGAAEEIAGWHKDIAFYPGRSVVVQTMERKQSWSVVVEAIELMIRLTPILGLYVHGSYSTGDFVESSDLDLSCIVSTCTAAEPKRLMEIRGFVLHTTHLFRKIDPLQHHGIYFLTKKMLSTYLECYLPLAVWEASTPIFGPTEIRFNVIKSEYHNKLWFEKSVEYYNNLDPETIQTLYDRKRFVCMANMIPCVLYPWKTGLYTTKPEAIKWMRREYPFVEKWAMEIAQRRIDNNYDDIENLVKETASICLRIKGESQQ